MPRTVLSLLVCATFVVPPLAASAALITVPTGLNPGGQYRLAFVTSTTRDATSSNIADYNAFVTTAANSVPALAALGATWSAIASTSSVDARDNTGTNWVLDPVGSPIYNLNNTLIASSNVDLWDSNLVPPGIAYTEHGTLATGLPWVWTGTYQDGTEIFAPLSLALGTAFPLYGTAGTGSPSWLNADVGDPSTTPKLLYALSGLLTVVPEPSTLVLAGMGLVGGLLGWRRRTGRPQSRPSYGLYGVLVARCDSGLNGYQGPNMGVR